MRRWQGWLLMSVFAVVLAGMAAQGDEEKVALDKVPKAVLKTVKAKFKGAEVVGAQTEKDGDKIVYEINLKMKGKAIDVSLTPDGKIVSVEKTIAAKDLPRPVAEAVNSKYPKSKLERVEEITEGDKKSYEVLIVTAEKKKVEVVLDRDGKIVKEEKVEEKKDKK
jgi:uncharacterized membrane protein YkoI